MTRRRRGEGRIATPRPVRAALIVAWLAPTLLVLAPPPALDLLPINEAQAQVPQLPDLPLPDLGDAPSPYGPRHEYGSRRMERGDRGTDVARLQSYLSRLGLATRVDGHYGSQTERNVHRWEAWRYRPADREVSRREAKRIRRQARDGRRYERRGHVFPVRGPHSYGTAASRFGASRGDHTHQGQDMAAAQDTKLVAVHAGRVAYRQYQAGGAGHYVVIHGRDRSDSVYMHLARPARVAPGRRVLAGEVIGRVGSTGSSTGPHLHFELWTPHWYDGGYPYDPLPKLRRWDRRT